MSKAKSGKKDLIVDVKEMRWVEIETLKEFQGNLKDLVDENYKKLKKDILALGFSEAITVWDDQGTLKIMNGHQRFRTLMRMKEEGHGIPQIPVVVIHAKDPREAALKVLSLTSQMGVMTGQGLYEFMNDHEITMEELTGSFRFPEINFDSFKMEFFDDPKVEPQSDEDEVPEVQKEAITKLGDIYQLGNHRLMCGDSTSIDSVDKLMDGQKADMVFTDPPYGLSNKWSGGTWGSNPMYADAKIWDQPLDQTDIDWIITLAPIVIIWGGNYYRVPPSRCWLSWTKTQQMETMADFELAWTNLDKVAKNWNGARNSEGKRQHPTQKPVALMEWGISLFSDPKNVLDLFGGSGTTLIACEKTKRKCFMMELAPKYCDLIITRWEKYSGKQAFLQNEDGTQTPFQELKAQAELVS